MKLGFVLMFLFVATSMYAGINEDNERGKALLMKGDFDTARMVFEGILKENPDYAPAVNSLIVIYDKSGELEKMLPLLRKKELATTDANEKGKISKKIDGTVSALKKEQEAKSDLSKADELTKQKKYNEAMALYMKYSDVKREEIKYRIKYGSGKCNYFLANYGTAEKSLLEVQNHIPDKRNEIEIYLCGIEYQKTKGLAWGTNPKDKYRNLINRLNKLMREAKDKEIATLAENLIVICTNETGKRLLELRRFDDAIKEFNSALKEYPESDSSAYSQLLIGYTYTLIAGLGSPEHTQWNQKMAVKELVKVYQKYKSNTEVCALALENMGCQLGALGSSKEQIAVYETIIKEFPKSSYADNAIYYLAEMNRIGGNWAKAIGYYEKILREYPESNFKWYAMKYSSACRENIKGVKQ